MPFCQVTRLQTTDLRAMAHVLQHTEVYHKPWRTQKHLGDSLGYGLLVSEGEKHRIQRKALNPAFGPSPVRELTAIMIDKANEVRKCLLI
jgi:cytochrome P450